MIKVREIIVKIENRLWSKIVLFSRSKSYYAKLYKSHWHGQFYKNIESNNTVNYYTAIPNPGAGIGHQIANWIAGYWFAKQFGLQFVHIPFSNSSWENFLGFGEGEQKMNGVVEKGYIKVRLPLFKADNPMEVTLQKEIIQSYASQKVVFVAEQDQYYRDQFGVMDAIKEKFHKAKARRGEQLRFSKDCVTIAIHVRRGDITVGQETQNPNLLMRWQDNDYYVKVVSQVIANMKKDKPIAIYLFSQGEKKDFLEFEQFSNLQYCLDWSAQESFLHMVYADVLISSKSSFSYKPALLSKGIKVCPQNFWHGYPMATDWLLVDDQGEFDAKLFHLN